MSTFANSIDGQRHAVRFVVKVSGVPFAFIEDANAPSGATSGYQKLHALDDIEFGTSRLDLEKRRQLAGTVRITLREPPDKYGSNGSGTVRIANLRDVFQPRVRPSGSLGATITAAASLTGGAFDSIQLLYTDDFDLTNDQIFDLNNDGAPDKACIWIDNEAFTWDGLASPTLTYVDRAEFGTSAAAHYYAAVGQAADIFKAPPSWRGRKVTISAYNLEDEATGGVSSHTTIGTYRLTGPPQYQGNGVWTLEAEDLIQNFAELPIYTGFRDFDGGSVDFKTTAAMTLDGDTVDALKQGDIPSYMLASVRRGDADTMQVCFKISSTNEGSDTVTLVETGDQLTPGADVEARTIFRTNGTIGVAYPKLESVRHVGIFRGDPVLGALYLLLSDEGDGTNSGYDALPGRTRTSYGGQQWRFGAAIPFTEINLSDITDNLVGKSAWGWVYMISEPTTVGEIMRWACEASGSYWYVNTSGVIQMKPLRLRLPASITSATLALNEDAILVDSPNQIGFSDEHVTAGYNYRGGYDPIARVHFSVGGQVDWEIFDRYPGGNLFADIDIGPAAIGERDHDGQRVSTGIQPTKGHRLHAWLRGRITEDSRARATITVEAGLNAMTLSVGDVVDVTNADIPDGEGGTISGAPCLIVSRQIDYNTGIVRFDLEVQERGSIWSPSMLVSTWTSGTKTIVFQSGAATVPWMSDPTAPTDELAAGWTLRFHGQASGGSVETATIASITNGTTIVLDSAPASWSTTAPSSGDVVTVAYTTGESDSAQGFDPVDFAYQNADAAGAKGTTQTRLS